MLIIITQDMKEPAITAVQERQNFVDCGSFKCNTKTNFCKNTITYTFPSHFAIWQENQILTNIQAVHYYSSSSLNLDHCCKASQK